jgi:Alkaline and neutral invertase
MDAQTAVKTARDLLFQQAMVEIDGQWGGSLAAIPGRNVKPEEDLNYSEIFIRDNVPVMVYLLMEGKYEAVKNFLTICLRFKPGVFFQPVSWKWTAN